MLPANTVFRCACSPAWPCAILTRTYVRISKERQNESTPALRPGTLADGLLQAGETMEEMNKDEMIARLKAIRDAHVTLADEIDRYLASFEIRQQAIDLGRASA